MAARTDGDVRLTLTDVDAAHPGNPAVVPTQPVDDDGNQVFYSLWNPVATAITTPYVESNHPSIWADYETLANLDIGHSGPGSLAITTGTAIRLEDVTLGTVSSGVGVLTVSGSGSVLNTAIRVVSGENAEFYNRYLLGEGDYTNPNATAIGFPPAEYDPPDLTAYPIRRIDNGKLVVGQAGIGSALISVGGRLEIGDGLDIGSASGGSGTLTVEGAGSTAYLQGTVEVFAGSRAFIRENGAMIVEDQKSWNGSALSTSSPGSLLNHGEIELGDSSLSGESVSVRAQAIYSDGVINVINDATILSRQTGTSPLTGREYQAVNSADFAFGNAGLISISNGATLTIGQANISYPIANLRQPQISAGTDPETEPELAAKIGVYEFWGGTLFCASPLRNYGLIKASAGENIVKGHVENWGASGDAGIILIDGDGVSVTFTDPVDNDGKIICAPGTRTTFAQGVTGTGTVYRLEGCPKAVILGVDEGSIEVLGESLDNDEGATA